MSSSRQCRRRQRQKAFARRISALARRIVGFEYLEGRILLAADAIQPGGGLATDFDRFDPSAILVRFREPAAGAHIAAQRANVVAGARFERSFSTAPGLQKIALPDDISVADALAAYRNSPDVLYAEPDYLLRTTASPNDPLFSQLWGLNNTGQTGGAPDVDIDAPEAWETITGASSTIVAVIDTGIDYTHEDLAGNMWVNALEAGGAPGVDDDGNGYVDDIHGYDFANDDGDPMDDHYHGTHVAGTLGAVGNNGVGISGVTWSVQIMAVKFLAADGTGTTSQAIAAIDYAVEQGAHLSNNSWGGNEPFSQALYDSIAAARDEGHIFVAGAGNGFFGIPLNNDNIPFYPASYDLDNIVSVAAVDHNNNIASFSNYGAVSVDLAAPGVNILSAEPGDEYQLLSGTSMAAPHVAGVLALLRDQSPLATYDELIARLYENVVPNSALAGKTVTGGVLNAANALPPERPEIAVLFEGDSIADETGVVDFGDVLIDTPAVRTITVRNVGTEPLVLDEQITVGGGFSLVAGFGDLTLEFDEATTFQVQADAQALGAASGDISFTSNDADESPFNFTLTANVTTAVRVDNGDAGFDVSGDWVAAVNVGYQNDHAYSASGTGADVATWTFAAAPGAYEIAATWKPGVNRATNAPFEILDGAASLATRSIDQQQAPGNFFEDGVSWERLGAFNVASGTLTVRLSDEANGFVIADAIRIERVDPSPEIEVGAGGVDIADNTGAVDFGVVPLAQPVVKTFTVANVGTSDLTLAEPIAAPNGFSIASTFAATTLSPGESTTFELRFDAAAAGAFSGEISFATNDSDENPFNFTVLGQVDAVQIIDNGDFGFSTTGDWVGAVNVGFQNDHVYSASGVGDDVAAWTFNVAPGAYEVSATWKNGVNRATNAPFTIFAGATPLAAVNVNQELAPNDFADAGANWERLGAFNVTGGVLTAQLSDAANEFVIADAIRIERIDANPEIEVRLDGNLLNDGADLVDFGAAPIGAPITKSFTVTNAGTADLSLSEPIATPVGFTVASSFATTTLAPGESTTFEIRFDAPSDGTFSGEVVFNNNDDDESPFNFTVSGQAFAVQIIDDGHPGFATTGAWGLGLNGGYEGDQRYNEAGVGNDTATWTFDAPAGVYRVAATWFAGANRATDSPFTILDAGNPLATFTIDQELTPGEFFDGGVGWVELGEFVIDSGQLVVRLTDAANEFVIADAIRIERIAGSPEIDVQVDGADVPDGVGLIDFGATLAGAPIDKTFTVTNSGTGPLALAEPIGAPAGFSVVSSFGATTLAPGESTTFQIRFDAAQDGDFSGEVAFGNNDADENPFNFAVTASASSVQVIDDGHAGFALVGSWGHGFNGGYEGDQRYNEAGAGNDAATWTFNAPPGLYRVAATWFAGANRATDSPFTILDGANPIDVVDVNQEVTPDEFFDLGIGWFELGDYAFFSGVIQVRLTDAANEFVIADAIRIERLGDIAPAVQGDAPQTDVPAAGDWLFARLGGGKDIASSAAVELDALLANRLAIEGEGSSLPAARRMQSLRRGGRESIDADDEQDHGLLEDLGVEWRQTLRVLAIERAALK